jgi:4-diphosphocytidyl-2-C-methyl-D-erythritol kinase
VIPGLYRVEAPAKVNLFLRILERMENGYHRLETAFQAISLADTLEVEVEGVVGVEVQAGPIFELDVRDEAGDPVDVGPVEDNLVTRAVRAFHARTGLDTALRVRLTKRIPSGAGLGGGSSDAGAMLRVLNRLHGDPLTVSELVELGGTLGADVAFFAGDAALALGRGSGTELTPVPALPSRSLVVGMPPVHVATGPAYGRLAAAREGGRIPPEILDASGWPALSAGAERGMAGADDPWSRVGAASLNDFQPVVSEAWPPVADALAALDRAGVAWRLLSGSGGALFGVLRQGVDQDSMVAELRRTSPSVAWYPCATLGELPPVERVEERRGIV